MNLAVRNADEGTIHAVQQVTNAILMLRRDHHVCKLSCHFILLLAGCVSIDDLICEASQLDVVASLVTEVEDKPDAGTILNAHGNNIPCYLVG